MKMINLGFNLNFTVPADSGEEKIGVMVLMVRPD